MLQFFTSDKLGEIDLDSPKIMSDEDRHALLLELKPDIKIEVGDVTRRMVEDAIRERLDADAKKDEAKTDILRKAFDDTIAALHVAEEKAEAAAKDREKAQERVLQAKKGLEAATQEDDAAGKALTIAIAEFAKAEVALEDAGKAYKAATAALAGDEDVDFADPAIEKYLDEMRDPPSKDAADVIREVNRECDESDAENGPPSPVSPSPEAVPVSPTVAAPICPLLPGEEVDLRKPRAPRSKVYNRSASPTGARPPRPGSDSDAVFQVIKSQPGATREEIASRTGFDATKIRIAIDRLSRDMGWGIIEDPENGRIRAFA